uniref:RING-type domain-containing protein n=1 Tax=Callorhinchus milii TaxID=7868 RepID=A0A4W3GSY9_CALMI
MDDLAWLDLLECPVCFERLEATAKVLPCQHTFCKACLQRIHSSRKELRCPECRTPVACGIEELPVNLLLVRLLHGMKHGQSDARADGARAHQPSPRREQARRAGDLGEGVTADLRVLHVSRSLSCDSESERGGTGRRASAWRSW